MARPPDPNAREGLIAAARVEFARSGIDHARVEDIARRAGLSKGAFYLHFESKDDVFRELVVRFLGVVAELEARRREVEEAFVAREGPIGPADVSRATPRFRALVELECACDVELLETMWRNREILAILESASGNAYRAMVDDFRRRMAAHLVGDLTLKQRQGRLRSDVDPTALCDLLLGSYDAFIRRMPGLRQKPDLAAWARTICTVVCEGMLPRADVAAGRDADRRVSRKASAARVARRRPAKGTR